MNNDINNVDVIIIGAGIAGISSAYYLQKNFPHLKYKIIEARNDLGGTWDQMTITSTLLISLFI